MLLEFRFGNFKSFREVNTLSMIASLQRDHNDSLIRREKDPRRILPVCAIFGPNASGKSNLIIALRFFLNLIELGNVTKTLRSDPHLNRATLRFLYDEDDNPILLGVVFQQGEKVYEYEVELVQDDKGTVSIAHEKLLVEGQEVFNRKGMRVTFGKNVHFYPISEQRTFFNKIINNKLYDSIEGQPHAHNEDASNAFSDLWTSFLDEHELFLTGGFKLFDQGRITKKIETWVMNEMQLFSDNDDPPPAYHSEEEANQAMDLMNAFLREADIGKQQVQYVKNLIGSDEDMILYSLYQIGNTSIRLPADVIESRGTLQLFRYLMPLIDALRNGKTVVVDELDASLHPFILAKIVGIFMDPDLNRKGAQLIFTTHSAILLDSSLMRRDSLAFVEKDSETFESTLYTLADFKTSGNKPVRNDESYLKNYLEGKYGALPNVNLSKTVRQALSDYIEK